MMHNCELGHVVVDTNRKTSCCERGKELHVFVKAWTFLVYLTASHSSSLTLLHAAKFCCQLLVPLLLIPEVPNLVFSP